MTNKGLASLFSNLAEEEFQQLERLYLFGNQISDASCAMLVSIIDSGQLPTIEEIDLLHTPASAVAQQAVYEAVMRAKQRRASAAAS